MGSQKKTTNKIKSFDEIKKVLVVEDSVCYGYSIKKAKQSIQEMQLRSICFFYFAAYVRKESSALVDFYIKEIERPRLFEWNFLHSEENTLHMCFDIDGVLCPDPTSKQNDDGKNYIAFIHNTSPKIVPSGEIGYLITSRLEKYRKETEQWLSKNNIKYKQLIMMDLPSAEERRKLNNHAEFKAEEYKKLKETILFVESSKIQAKKIAELTKKPVFCVEDASYYDTTSSHKILQNNKKYKTLIRKILHSILTHFK